MNYQSLSVMHPHSTPTADSQADADSWILSLTSKPKAESPRTGA